MPLSSPPSWNADVSSLPDPQRPDGVLFPAHLAPASLPPPAEDSLRVEDLMLPRSIGGVFDLAFDIYRRHFAVIMTTAAAALLPLQAVLYLLFNLWLKPLNNYAEAHSDNAGAGLLLIVGGLCVGYPPVGIPGLLALLVLAAASAPVALAVSEVYGGRTPLWSDCCRRAIRRIPHVLLAWTVAALGFVAVFSLACFLGFILLTLFAVALSAYALTTAYSVLFAIMGIAAVVVPLLLGMTLIAFNFCFTTPLIVLENTGVTQLPSRCWQLIGRPRALRTWTALVFLPVVFFIVQMLMLGSISSFLSLFSLPPVLRFLTETGLTALLIAFLQPYLLVFLNVLYFDARIQREGLDIQLLASEVLEVSPRLPARGEAQR